MGRKITANAQSITVAAVSAGGTGRSSLTANNLISGNGIDQVNLIAPSTAGNILTSNGSSWESIAPAANSTELGGIGTYIYAHQVYTNTIVPGGLLSGANLRYVFSVWGSSNGSIYSAIIPPGTYRCMGYGVYNTQTLWVRVL